MFAQEIKRLNDVIMASVKNPYRPGAGQLPPYLAGREPEIDHFQRSSLQQSPILTNLIISGLRGVGKTVLLDTLRPLAVKEGWIWAGADMSEAAGVSEKNLSTRIITDLASSVSHIVVSQSERKTIGYTSRPQKVQHFLNFDILHHIYSNTPGLESDRLKGVLKFTWEICKPYAKGIILAYDEAQNLKDKANDKEYPLSLLLEITQYVQRMQMPYLLVLTGLPTLLSNLVEARTYSERMFHQVTLGRLTDEQSRQAITTPLQKENDAVQLSGEIIDQITRYSGGYPYFIQYICKETYDSITQQFAMGISPPKASFEDIVRKLDTDFYQGRWNKATDKQRHLLSVIAGLENAEQGFSLKNIELAMKRSGTAVSASAINTMLKALTESGLVYKVRHGIYAFGVPLFSYFIRRTMMSDD